MTITDLTAIIGGAAAFITSGGALYVSTRSSRASAANNTILSWESLAKDRNAELIKIRAEMKESDLECKRNIRDLRREHESSMHEYQRKIVSLESQVADLIRQLSVLRKIS